jgi:D-3-phosphoglycerate dehydrogenase
MKVLVTGAGFCKPVMKENLDYLASFANEVVNFATSKPHTAEEILAAWDGVDGIIAGVEPYTAEMLEKAPPSLKVISRYGVGFNSIDVEAAKKRGILVTNTPGANSAAVAELAMGLLLAVVRNIPSNSATIKAGKWERQMSIGLEGRTLGILGLGSIGRNVARMARAFRMQVIAYDLYWPAQFAEEHGIVRVHTVEEVLQQSNMVSLHLPVTEETTDIINARTLGLMRPGAYLVNAARGELTDLNAVYEALVSGRLAGYGADVFKQEPPEKHPIMDLPNAVFTAHTGAFTEQAALNMGKAAIDNLRTVLETGDCPTVVNR